VSWNKVKLGDIAKVGAGNSAPQEDNLFEEGTHNFYRTSDVGKIRFGSIGDSKDKLNDIGIRGLKLHEEGTILFPKSGASTFLNHRVMLSCEGYVSSHLATIKAIQGKAVDKYLLYFLSTIESQNLVQDSNYPSLKTSAIEKIEFFLPSLATQQKIVAKLDAIFAEIDKAVLAKEANVKNSEALFKSYLFEVFEQGGTEWTDKKLTDVATYMGRGKSKHRPRNDASLYGGDYPFIQTGDVRNCDKFITSYTQTYNDKGLAQSKLWKANTVCITIAANIAEIGILSFDACFPDSVIGVVVDKEKVSEDFLYLMLLFAQQRIKDKSKGSAQENINLATFEDMFFKVAPLEQQKIIIQKFNDLKVLTDVIRDSNLKKLNDFSNLKNSILKKAFSGELVKD
jgi:type I restriction enzyme S subunit